MYIGLVPFALEVGNRPTGYGYHSAGIRDANTIARRKLQKIASSQSVRGRCGRWAWWCVDAGVAAVLDDHVDDVSEVTGRFPSCFAARKTPPLH